MTAGVIALGLPIAVGAVAVGVILSSPKKGPARTAAVAAAEGGPPAAGTGLFPEAGAILGGELAVNGSFEDGPEPGPDGFTTLEAGSTAVRGWTVTRGSVDHIGPTYWQHADGARSLDLNGSGPGAVAQTLRTRPGQKYRVTFRLAANVGALIGRPTRSLTVSAAGSQGSFTADGAGRTYFDMGWAARAWEFVATGAETTLEFASTTDWPPECGPALDQVSVVAVGR